MSQEARGTKKDREARRAAELAAEELRVVGSGDVEEIAGFYDRTDTSELPWEEETEAIIERPELEQISIRLPKEDLEAIRRRAARSGVGYTTLIRMILREHLNSPLTR